MVHDRLRGFVEGKVLSIPGGDAGVQLDRVVGLGRGDVGFIHLDRGGLKGLVWITAMAVDVELVIGFEVIAHVRLFCLVGHLDGIGRGDSLFVGECHHRGDVLAVVADDVVIEWRTALVEIARQAIRGRRRSKELAQVLARIHGLDSRHTSGRRWCRWL